MFFYQALGVQPGDKAAATRELAKLAKQKEIAPHSITPAQDRILATVGKTDAYNLPIDPESMLRRLLPPPPDRPPVPMAKTNMPMDTQLEIRPEFQNRTDAWRPGIAVPQLDPAEQAVQKAFENSGRPVMEGTKSTPTQKDVDSKSKWTKERRNKFDKDVPPIGEDTETDEDGDGGE
jgi:hypothetical protein